MLDVPCLACLSLSVAPWNVSSGQERDLWFNESVSLIKVLYNNLSQNLLNVFFSLCIQSWRNSTMKQQTCLSSAIFQHFAIWASLKSHLLCLYASLIAITHHWFRLIQIIFSPWIANNWSGLLAYCWNR